MRYLNSPTHSFTDANGITVSVYEQLPVPTKAASFLVVECDGQTSLEEIASRDDMYGAGAEGSSYKIFDENVRELVEVGFDLAKMRTLRVPV